MELRRYSHLHFIWAIRAGSVEKVLNVDYRGRPALAFKKLEDIYEIEDAKKKSQDNNADMVSACGRVKTEIPCLLPLVERKTKEKDINVSAFNHKPHDDEEGINDINFVKMTLKQLKERCKTKKRKVFHSVCLSPKQDNTDWQPEEDDCDFKETISSWKSKLSKNLNGKRKRAKKCATSFSQTKVSVKFDQLTIAEGSLQSSGCILAPTDVKFEVSEEEYSESREMICVAEILQPVKSELGYGELTEAECQTCYVNEVCYDHLEPIEPNCLLPSIGGETMEEDNLKINSQQFIVFPASEDKGEGYIEHPLPVESYEDTIFPVKNQGSDLCTNFQSNSSVHEISRQPTSKSGVQVPDLAMDNNLCCMGLDSAGDLCKFEDDTNENLPPTLEMHSPKGNRSSSWSSNNCLSPEIVLVSAEDGPLATKKPLLRSIKCGSTAIVENQPLISSTFDDAESNSFERNHHGDSTYDLSLLQTEKCHNLEQYHPPERLLSTRKTISPTSQEKLCRAMKELEFNEMTCHYKCTDKLQFGKEVEIKVSPAGPETAGAEVNINPEALEVTENINHRQITKKPKNGRKGSPPKCFRKGPYLSRSLPHLSTRASSVQSCSERAIAFSQRQMQDIDSLAMKLMQELKFMKDIVEEKMQSETSPTTSVKYDVDEMKTAIKSAAKVEETTRKWLSMMARDCNRFCKLMRVTEKGEIASGNATHKGRRKITFADEAGGVLCHVKFIGDDMASLDSKGQTENTT